MARKSFRDGMSDIVNRFITSRRGSSYAIRLDASTIENAYISSGMMRKIVNMPARDAVRDWREWQGDAKVIEAITKEEKRLNLQNVVKQAEVMRSLGGGAIYLGMPGEPETPAPANISPGQLVFVHVVNRWQLTIGQMIDDAANPLYGQPEYFEMRTTTGQKRIHPSRMVVFKGSDLPSLSRNDWQYQFWGESVVDGVKDDVENYEAAKVTMLRYLSKAGYMRIGIPNLTDYFGSSESEAQLVKRIEAIVGNATSLDAVVYDAGNGGENPGESITDAAITLTGVVDTINGYGAQIAANIGWPVTKILGTSATGLNSSGDGEQRDWNKIISARQTLDIDPCLAQFDKYLLQSAGVKDEISYTWPSLSQPTQKEEAERFNTIMDGVTKLQNTGAIPDQALAKGVQSLMTEEGWLPGLANALAEIPEDERFGMEPPIDNGIDPAIGV